MEKINFIDNVTKGSAETFNTMQDNIEKTLNIYSADEIAIGTWFEKPLYRKVIDFGALPDNNIKILDHNINNIDFITHYHGISYRDTDNVFFELPYYASVNGVSIYINKNRIELTTTNDRSEFKQTYITIEYTKTTD